MQESSGHYCSCLLKPPAKLMSVTVILSILLSEFTCLASGVHSTKRLRAVRFPAATPYFPGKNAVGNAGDGGTAGLVAPVLYRNSADLNDITLGNNGFEAGPGWDPVTGLGSPKGEAIAATLSEASIRS